jgi:hypothetical protein
MKKLFLITLSFLVSLIGFSQVANYSYTATTSTWASNSSPTPITGLGAAINDALSSSINIGFNFIYDGTTYTQFKASSNGFLTFNTVNTLAQPTNNLNTSTDRVILAVLWDDNQTGASGNVNYKLTGTSPNQILTVEWLQLRWNKNGFSAGTIDCQIKLYETSNKIEYIYNRGAYQSFGNSTGIGASIGIGGATSGDFISLSDLVASPTKSTTVETTTIGTSPTNLTTKTAAQANVVIPNGTKYIFGPPPTIITSGSLSAFTSCSGFVSSEQSYSVFGFGLTADITITAPTGFELSTTSGSGFTSPLTLTQSSGSVSSTTIYVRLKTTATGSPSGNITNASTSATTKNVSASGTVTTSVTPSVSVSGTSSICSGTSVTFTATPTNGGSSPSYQWKKNGTNVGTNSTTYTNAALVNGDVISCVMTANNTCQTTSTGTSNSITMSISQPSVGGTVASDQSVMSGGNASTINLTGHTGSVTKWQRSTVLDFSTFTDVANTTTSVSGASMGGITETIYYRAVVQNGTCPSVNSSSVKITVVNGLPIELLYFKGDPHIVYNKLYWVTASENNNDYFNIYRSVDGVYFKNIFTVKGAGNSTHNLYYEVIDRDFDPTINYYVLRQTDYDGRWKESDIISVDNRGESAPILLKVTNILGQDVSDDSSGVLLYHYSDGTILRRYH